MQNKKVLFLSIVLGIIAVVFPVQAQEKKLEIISSPVVTVEKITLDSVGENINPVSGVFTINNQENKDFYDLYAEIKAYRMPDAPKEGENVDPNYQFNIQNWTLVASSVSAESLSIKSKEKKQSNFNLNILKNHPAGTYVIQVNLYQKDYAQTGSAMSQQFTLAGNNNFLKLSNPKVIRSGKEYPAEAGVDFGAGEAPKLSFGIKNIGTDNIKAIPKLIIFERNQFGKQSGFKDLSEYTVEAGKEAIFEEKIDPITEPGAYLAQIQFFKNGEVEPISAPTYLRFVVRGISGRILNLSSDKDLYKKGDVAKISVNFVGSADTFVRDAEGNVVSNAERVGKDNAIIKVSITDKNGNLQSTKDVSLGNSQTVFLDIPTPNDVQDFKLKAILEKDGKILSEKEISIETKKEISENKKPMNNKIIYILIGALFVAIIMFVIGLRKRNSTAMFLMLIIFASIFVLASKPAQAQLIENWSSPANGTHYRTTSAGGDIVSLFADPKYQYCSNGAAVGGAGTGFFINGSNVSQGFSGIGWPTVNMPGKRLGANTAYFVADFSGYGSFTSSTRTFYIDTAQLHMFVMSGASFISGATVDCGGRIGTTTSSVDFWDVPAGSITCTASKAGYNSGSLTLNVDQVVKSGTIQITPAPAVTCGSASGTFPVSQPTTGLCSDGSNPSLVDEGWRWRWSCGSNSCEARKKLYWDIGTCTGACGTVGTRTVYCRRVSDNGIDMGPSGIGTESCVYQGLGLMPSTSCSMPACVNRDPEGWVDDAQCSSGGLYEGIGWAIDRDALSTSISISVYVDGVYKTQCTTNLSRSDINSAYGATGNHGFYCSVPGLSVGNHTVNVYAINTPIGNNPLLRSMIVNCAVPAINGSCGTAATTYAATATAFSGTTCSQGSGTLPAFPAQGGTANWWCYGSGGGSNAYCSAYRNQPAGQCGSANGVATFTPPGSGLCTTGTASSVTTNASTYTWTCAGNPSANCSAPRKRDATCGTANRTFASTETTWGAYTACGIGTGSLPAFPAQGATANWTCTGINSGANASCSAYRTGPPGACGTSNGSSFSSPPTTNLCIAGTVSSVTTNTNSYDWTCTGSTTATCSATRTGQSCSYNCGSNVITANSGTYGANCYDTASVSCGSTCTYSTGYCSNGNWTPAYTGGTSLTCSVLGCPVNGACDNANAKNFLATDTAWATPNACSAGTGALPGFPSTGGTVNWTCTGSNGGTDASCTATRDCDPIYSNHSCTLTPSITCSSATCGQAYTNAPVCTATSSCGGGTVTRTPADCIASGIPCAGTSGICPACSRDTNWKEVPTN